MLKISFDQNYLAAIFQYNCIAIYKIILEKLILLKYLNYSNAEYICFEKNNSSIFCETPDKIEIVNLLSNDVIFKQNHSNNNINNNNNLIYAFFDRRNLFLFKDNMTLEIYEI